MAQALLVATTIAVAVLGAACSGATRTTEKQLRAKPESSLLYPGSRAVRRVGADEHPQTDGAEPDPAFAGVIATASTSAGALLEWYSKAMVARGYRPATYYRLANQVDGRAWSIPHTREQVQVAIYRADAGVAGAVAAGMIAYEEILVDYRVTGPPPN